MSSALVTKLYDELENRILSNYYPEDETVTELGIANEFNVSRTPVREALRLLMANGLVIDDPEKGLCVRSYTHKDMLDIYDLRIMMEGLSAKLCVENIDDDAINKLNENVLLQDMYLSQKNILKIWELDDLFHGTIHEATKNRLLRKMLDDFHHVTKYVRKMSYDTEGRCEASVREHREIFEAIKARDAELAEKRMVNHVSHVKTNLIALGF